MVEPIQEMHSTGGLIPAVRFPLRLTFSPTVTRDGELAVFVDDEKKPWLVAFSFIHTGLDTTDFFPDTWNRVTRMIAGHVTSVMRLMYREDFRLFNLWLQRDVDDGAGYEFNIAAEVVPASAQPFDGDHFQRAFTNGFQYRVELQLLADGVNKEIPSEYRVLSLVKLLEFKLRNKGKRWDKERLKTAFDPYAERIASAGFNTSAVNSLQDIRDSCAHIHSSSGKLGAIQVNPIQAGRVESFLPILLDVCIALMNHDHPEFEFGTR